jgi:hypothetical protein
MKWFFMWSLFSLLVGVCAVGCKQEWSEFIPKDEKFSVVAPRRLRKIKIRGDEQDVNRPTLYMYRLQQRDYMYVISYVELEPGVNPEEVIKAFTEASFIRVGIEIIQDSFITLNNFNGREIVYRDNRGTYTLRIIETEDRIYFNQAGFVHGSTHTENVSRFLDSFKIY